MKHLDAKIISTYRQMVEKAHPDGIGNWPILNGYNLRFGKYRGWNIFLFENTGNPIALKIPLEHLTAAIVGIDDNGSDIELARKKLTRYYRLSKSDMLVILNTRSSNLIHELDIAFAQHETLYKNKAAEVFKSVYKETSVVPETEIPIKADKPEVEQVDIPQLQQEENKRASEIQEQRTTPEKMEEAKSEVQPFKNRVFLINGANDKMKKSMRNFLLSLGLQAVEWAEALILIGKPEPDYADVISNIFEHCQVAVILLTNDKRETSFPGEESELKFISQAELNAVFMAGLTAGIKQHRTIVVGLGNPVPFCDIPGLCLSSLDNSKEKRKEFIERLKIAGCDLKPKGRAWQISGDFDIEIKPLFTEILRPPQPVNIETAQEIQGSLIQPDTAAHETDVQSDEDKSSEIQPNETAPKNDAESAGQSTRGRSLMDSLPIINMLKTKKQPKKRETATEFPADSQQREFVETIQSDFNATADAKEKLTQKKHDHQSGTREKKESSPEEDMSLTTPPETKYEFKGSQKPLEDTTSKKTTREYTQDENEYLERIKALEEKLETQKTRPGRINQRAIDDLEKQIQAENYRLRTIRQLANIENLKKNYLKYEKYSNKEIKKDE